MFGRAQSSGLLLGPHGGRDKKSPQRHGPTRPPSQTLVYDFNRARRSVSPLSASASSCAGRAQAAAPTPRQWRPTTATGCLTVSCSNSSLVTRSLRSGHGGLLCDVSPPYTTCMLNLTY